MDRTGAGPSKLGPARCRSESVGTGRCILGPVPRRDSKKRCKLELLFLDINSISFNRIYLFSD